MAAEKDSQPEGCSQNAGIQNYHKLLPWLELVSESSAPRTHSGTGFFSGYR